MNILEENERRGETELTEETEDCLDLASYIFLTIFSHTFVIKLHFNFVIFVSDAFRTLLHSPDWIKTIII